MAWPNGVLFAARIIMWILWCCHCCALICYRLFLVESTHNTCSLTFPVDVFALGMYSAPVALTLLIRWLVIPRITHPFVTLIPFLFGLSFAEALTFYGLYLFQPHFTLFFCTSCILLLQFMPIWKQKVAC